MMSSSPQAETHIHLRQLAFGLAAGVLGAAPNRMAIWTYGCNRGCAGCSSAHTWQKEAATEAHWVSITALLQLARQRNVQGLTISGGEPVLQATAITNFARRFKLLLPEKEIVLYTGLRFDSLCIRAPELVKTVDVVIAGPYVQSLPPTALAGSNNQEVKLLTPLAQRLFAGWQSWPRAPLQVSSHSSSDGHSQLITVGIPDNRQLTLATQQITGQVHQLSWPSNEEARKG